MLSEDLKKQFMTSRESFTAKRWEGKPFSFKFKFALANYPEMMLCGFVLIFLVPPISYWRWKNYPESRRHAIQKYKANYIVVRDDHPDIDKIIEEKERGRHYFPSV